MATCMSTLTCNWLFRGMEHADSDTSTGSGRTLHSGKMFHKDKTNGGEKKKSGIGDSSEHTTILPSSSLHKSRSPDSFLLSLTGRIESGELFGVNDVYCKYNFSFGPDWQFTSGLEEGISQIASKDVDGKFVWNFPLEVIFKSSNPYGWPQLVVSLFGTDFLGNHVTMGYGATFLPVASGLATKNISLFVPESSSFIQKISSWIVGRRPEFIDPKLIAQGEGRQVTRVNSRGHVVVKFETLLKDFANLGYTSSSLST